MSLIKNIYIENNSNHKLGITPKEIKANIKKVIDHMTNLKGYEFSLLVTSDEEIQKINLAKRGKDKAKNPTLSDSSGSETQKEDNKYTYSPEQQFNRILSGIYCCQKTSKLKL